MDWKARQCWLIPEWGSNREGWQGVTSLANLAQSWPQTFDDKLRHHRQLCYDTLSALLWTISSCAMHCHYLCYLCISKKVSSVHVVPLQKVLLDLMMSQCQKRKWNSDVQKVKKILWVLTSATFCINQFIICFACQKTKQLAAKVSNN